MSSGAEPPLKTVPRGYASTHPRAELLRWKGAVVVQEYERADWLHTRAVLDRIREVWRGAQPLKAWLDTHVGAAEGPAGAVRDRRKRA